MYAKLKGSGESQAAYAEKLEDDDAVMKAVSCAHAEERGILFMPGICVGFRLFLRFRCADSLPIKAIQASTREGQPERGAAGVQTGIQTP